MDSNLEILIITQSVNTLSLVNPSIKIYTELHR
jgi:hypothetical protein